MKWVTTIITVTTHKNNTFIEIANYVIEANMYLKSRAQFWATWIYTLLTQVEEKKNKVHCNKSAHNFHSVYAKSWFTLILSRFLSLSHSIRENHLTFCNGQFFLNETVNTHCLLLCAYLWRQYIKALHRAKNEPKLRDVIYWFPIRNVSMLKWWVKY